MAPFVFLISVFPSVDSRPAILMNLVKGMGSTKGWVDLIFGCTRCGNVGLVCLIGADCCLYLREGNPVEDLGYQNGREECGNARQKSVVLALMDLWSPYVGLEELVGAVAATHGPIPKKLSALKKVILNRMELEAKSRIIKKIHKEGWSGGISPEWVVLLAGAPKKIM